MKLEPLRDEAIGDLLDLDSRYEYPCSDGGSLITLDVRPVAQASQKDTVRQIVEWGNESCPHPSTFDGQKLHKKKSNYPLTYSRRSK